ncbi:Phosphoglycerate mutase [Xylanimonas cellulosilytica DSM 15894]|uniref:Phosphoglycerate mutase n=1 Tax=Xylanimonas cellulosilytica (strain DSM 15894 / JCM 12276 / CECT 5975 / KCTC 9989 / LMG 20990 / NBRC 107835 / XIL07) TaxID=446471 RepID=D1BWA3_XYLCX|nr:histidine phosphatase family protein [Xylanimonas cellulosilytica]ACZ31448.1 Phosphoglycerate mutase [Xylanimonas cellulosilytica DSM 15894]
MTRRLSIARHGEADAFGSLTDTGRHQAARLGERLAAQPIDVIWHSPLPRAQETAAIVAEHLPGVPVLDAPELIDHVPYVPAPGEAPSSWAGFFDGFDDAEASHGHALADALTRRFGAAGSRATHEVLITHAYQVAWLVRHALAAPPVAWLRVPVANTGLTVVEHRAHEASALLMLNDLSHLPRHLRWTGFAAAPP